MTQLPKSSSKSWVQNVFGLVIVTAIIAAPALLTAFFLHAAGQQKKYPPELQELVDRYNQIEEEMTEEQVDAILSGYQSGTTNEIRESDDQVFKRKSSYSKTYYKSGVEEGDHLLRVFLDQDRYVVGKSIKGITR